ncbi:hypothetical protein SK128_027095 [Halocaridina rubra]|uniref:Uncharacterized protein n=1 Tax=Halocaridina rubra TaxID=373956 RepID=A0AAN8XC55_HALRR
MSGHNSYRLMHTASNHSSPLRRDRPQSLNLGHGQLIRKISDPETPRKTDYLEKDDVPMASLQDLPGAVAATKTASLAEQFSATSLEKLRRLKHKLHRALGSHDGTISLPTDDVETSPLVLATPLSANTPNCPSPTLAADLEESNSVNHYPEIRSRPLTPLVRQNAREMSPTPQITCKPQSSSDRETPV